MKWTQRQKIAGAVLTLAASVFGVDRMFASGEPTEVDSAALVPQATQTVMPMVRTARTQDKVEAVGSALARRLEQAAADDNLKPGEARDVFRPPAAWYANAGTAGLRAGSSDPGATFRSRYRLTAVMRGGAGKGVAAITGPSGNLTIRVGQSVDGFVLTSVTEHRVTLSNGANEVSLDLERPGIAAASH